LTLSYFLSFTVRLTDPDGNLVDGATVVKSE
jgi:hypothetical protein